MAQKHTDTGVLELAVSDLERMKPDEIAALMRKRKIGGRPGTTGNCPLARLMHGIYGGQFIVGPKFVARRCGTRLEKIPTPQPLVDFLRGFDLSRYPDLIMPPPRVLPKKVKAVRRGPKRKQGPRVNHPAKLVGRW